MLPDHLGDTRGVGVPGQRTACFRIKSEAAAEIMSGWLEKTAAMRELLDRGLEMLAGEADEARARLRAHRDFHAFIERELPPLLDKWKRETGEGDLS